MAVTPSERIKRSAYFDADVLEWLRARGQGLDRSVDWQIREILRAAMDADQRRDIEAVA